MIDMEQRTVRSTHTPYVKKKKNPGDNLRDFLLLKINIPGMTKAVIYSFYTYGKRAVKGAYVIGDT